MEAVVAALVLVVGVLATAGAVAGAARDGRRAWAVERGAQVLAERTAEWRRAPCAAGVGERVVGAGRERWAVRVAGGLGVLSDTVTSGAEPSAARVGLVATMRCGPGPGP